MIKVFGHKAPDTDATASAIIWAWYLEQKGETAIPYVLGEPNTEAAFVVNYWGFDSPEILKDIEHEQDVIIVDTNNTAELPENINNANIIEIIDHHLVVGNLKTKNPISVTIKPLASTASIMAGMMGDDLINAPKVSIYEYAKKMFEAKTNVSQFYDQEVLRMDSKEYEGNNVKMRISVLETTSPALILSRKDSLMNKMELVAKEDNVDQVLLFVVDILNEQATLLVPNGQVKQIAEKSFKVTVESDVIVLPGIVSRKKQIIPNLVI